MVSHVREPFVRSTFCTCNNCACNEHSCITVNCIKYDNADIDGLSMLPLQKMLKFGGVMLQTFLNDFSLFLLIYFNKIEISMGVAEPFSMLKLALY